MPRGRRNPPQLMSLDEFTEIMEDENHVVTVPKMPRFVSDHLKNQLFDLMKETNRKAECPICMEEITCKHCFTVNVCGHYGHMCCLLKCNSCPVCRA